MLSGDPRFVGRSSPGDVGRRDLGASHLYTIAGASRDSPGNPYWYGAILASTFWSYRGRLVSERGLTEADARAHMSTVAFDGLVRAPDVGLLEIESALWSSFVARATELGERDAFCASFTEHFAAHADLSKKVCQ